MRSLALIAVVHLSLTAAGWPQTPEPAERTDPFPRWTESGWQRQSPASRSSAGELTPIPDRASGTRGRRDSAGSIAPAQHQSPSGGPPASGENSSDPPGGTSDPPSASPSPGEYLPNYIPPTSSGLPSDEHRSASVPESQFDLPSAVEGHRPNADERPVNPTFSPAEPSAIPVPASESAAPTWGTPPQSGSVAAESSPPAPFHPANSEPVPPSRRTYPLSMLLLFASIGLNIYLIWVAVDTYHRYQDLVNDMRTTRSRRDGRRYADESLESSTY